MKQAGPLVFAASYFATALVAGEMAWLVGHHAFQTPELAIPTARSTAWFWLQMSIATALSAVSLLNAAQAVRQATSSLFHLTL